MGSAVIMTTLTLSSLSAILNISMSSEMSSPPKVLKLRANQRAVALDEVSRRVPSWSVDGHDKHPRVEVDKYVFILQRTIIDSHG